MSLVIRWLKPTTTVYAHCDVPCGILRPSPGRTGRPNRCSHGRAYRPATQGEPDRGGSPEVRPLRCRQGAARRDREARDPGYLERLLQAEHLERYPDIHDRTWKILKLAGKNKQNIDAQAAADLEAAVKEFADIFWSTKK